MSILQQQRQDILMNDNTAQQRFEQILAQMENVSTLHIQMELNGDLDLSLMKDEKYQEIEEIIFSEGRITSIVHVPNGIKKLVIAKNILISLEDLPKSLIFLDITENNIQSIDLSYLKNLNVLHCEDNKLEEILLPKDIKELYAQNNDLKHLNAQDFPGLRVLNVENNPLLIIDNFGLLSLDVFETRNNPLLNAGTNDVKESDKESEEKVEYLDSLNKYFQYKSTYERDAKRKCIKCKRKCGTIFSNKDFYYTAICGSKTDPCKLNIKLYRGEFGNNDDLVNTMKEYVEKDKEQIIIQKMETIFAYISEAESAKLFQQKMETYTENSELYGSALGDYNKIVDNFEKKKRIAAKRDAFYGYKRSMKAALDAYVDTKNKQKLKEAVDIYINSLQPTSELLQNLKYPLMEVNDEDGVSVLHQYELLNSDREMSFAEPPKVEKFVI